MNMNEYDFSNVRKYCCNLNEHFDGKDYNFDIFFSNKRIEAVIRLPEGIKPSQELLRSIIEKQFSDNILPFNLANQIQIFQKSEKVSGTGEYVIHLEDEIFPASKKQSSKRKK